MIQNSINGMNHNVMVSPKNGGIVRISNAS
jgi:hypothetical protein